MSKLKKIISISFFLLIVIFFILSIIVLSQSFYKNDKELLDHFENDHSIKIQYFELENIASRTLNFTNQVDTSTHILMVHGSPGSVADFQIYFSSTDLRTLYNLTAIERVGYGSSVRAKKHFSIVEQADFVEKITHLKVHPSSKILLLSHSYGGPVAALLANRLGSRCLGHVMVAPVIDPFSEEMFWYSSVPLLWPFKFLSSPELRRASLEKLNHKNELMELLDYWPTIQSETVHIHGDKDWLAPFQNQDFCLEYFESSCYYPITINEGSHFILWQKKEIDLIVEELVRLGENNN